MTALKPPKEVLPEVDKIRKRFLWAGNKAISGGKCKVNWMKTTLLKECGGLGILDLERFGRPYASGGYGMSGLLRINLG